MSLMTKKAGGEDGMKDRFSVTELSALRNDLLQSGMVDSREAAEVLQVFLIGSGYGVSAQAAMDAAVINRGTSILSHYAHATGGDVYYAARGSSLPDLYSHVSEQARHQYTLGYVPSGTSRSQDYHSIEVRIRRPELTLLTRDGYYQIPRP